MLRRFRPKWILNSHLVGLLFYGYNKLRAVKFIRKVYCSEKFRAPSHYYISHYLTDIVSVKVGSSSMKVRIKRWHGVAVWKWDVDDDVCGICRMPFEACCPGAKYPGDDCPPGTVLSSDYVWCGLV